MLAEHPNEAQSQQEFKSPDLLNWRQQFGGGDELADAVGVVFLEDVLLAPVI